jgi:hypothetical protein
MIQTAGYMLLVRDLTRSAELKDYADEDLEFAESVPSFTVPARDRLIALLSLSPGIITHISRAKRGRSSATSRRRLNLIRTVELRTPIAVNALLDMFPVDLRDRLLGTFEGGGLIPAKQWALVQELLVSAFDEASAAIESLIPFRERVIDEMSPTERETMALEHEAVAAALRLAGFGESERETSLAWNPSATARRGSFLDGLDAVPLREDTMIQNDMQVVPGFERLDQTKFGAVRFENDDTRLILLHANHQRLEETLGVDLIYYNHSFHSFVCVQYKAMEQEHSGAVFRFPKDDLTKEIARMDSALKLLGAITRNAEPHGFRLNENPFFLKFCPRVIFEPDKPELIRGMYLPIDYWRLLEQHPSTLGPRQGRQLTFDNAGRHFDNTGFIYLVSKGWIGSNTEQSTVLGDIVNAILSGQRSVTLAVKFDKRDPSEPPARVRVDLSGGTYVEEEPAHAHIRRSS